jgi:hypothetical protein
MKKCENCQWFRPYKQNLIEEATKEIAEMEYHTNHPSWWHRMWHDNKWDGWKLAMLKSRLEEYTESGMCALNPKMVPVLNKYICSHHTPVTPKQLLGDHTK